MQLLHISLVDENLRFKALRARRRCFGPYTPFPPPLVDESKRFRHYGPDVAFSDLNGAFPPL